MNTTPIFIDCDGQIDSFWGLAAALSCKELAVKAVSVSAGKLDAESSFENVRGFAGFLGCKAPLYKGSERPVLTLGEKPVWNRFGQDGKCGLPISGNKAYEAGYAWDALYRIAKDCGGELTVVCFGPMTNLAIALFKYEELKNLIKKVVYVGGSYDFGNFTQVAEINMATDPEAARAVFRSGMEMDMIGYNALRASSACVSEARELAGTDGHLVSEFFLRSCISADSWRTGELYFGPCLAVASLCNEGLVGFERYHVTMETKSSLCRGRTTPLNMYAPRGYVKNTNVAMTVDRKKYNDFLRKIISGFCEKSMNGKE